MITEYLYGVITSTRNTLFDSAVLRTYRAKLPVLSVGNLSVGGNGKTPLCVYIVRRLIAIGKRPVVLLRGYGGNVHGPHIVAPSDTAYTVGDEAVMLAQQVAASVVVSKRRVAGAKLIERDDLGDVIVLDDGFQHRWLSRNLDIVAVDASSDASIEAFLLGRLLPGGRFREDRDRGLRRAHAVVINSRSTRILSDAEIEQIRGVLPVNVEVFSSHLQHDPVVTHDSAVAICGLANPAGFFASVRSLGFTRVVEKAFADHHVFSDNELKTLLEEYDGWQLLCSHKDFVRLPAAYHGRFTPLSANLVLNDPAKFDQLIHTSIS